MADKTHPVSPVGYLDEADVLLNISSNADIVFISKVHTEICYILRNYQYNFRVNF